MKRWIIGLVGILVSATSFAELTLPALFSDGMVLQRDQQVPVWGWADPGQDVTVSFAGQQQTAKTDQVGKFMVRFAKMDASKKPRTLVVKAGSESVEVSNVLVGEVWLCSGQSNMEMPVSGWEPRFPLKNATAEIATANHPFLRLFQTERAVSQKPENDCKGKWDVCTPQTVGAFSATAYFFGRDLLRKLDVPIGLIQSCWGGTGIEAWSPMASLEQFQPVWQDKLAMDRKSAAFDDTVSNARYAKQLEAWRQKVKKANADGKKTPKRPGKPVDPHASQNYPANLYNAMINPLVPYGIRGAIWYQGEHNAHSVDQAMLYRALLENMVSQWRKVWGSGFPFYAVQLPNYKKPQTQPVQDSGWAFIRESFLKFSKEVPNTGIAVGIDVGEADKIHPGNKQAIGRRLSQQALAKTYGEKNIPGGPVYKSMKKDGNKIIIHFNDVGAGLVEQGGEPLKTFAIAGADKKFFAAQAAIVGNTLIVSSTEVPRPVAVRYAWADNPVGCNLFNKDGFPASPFRTDDWPPAEE